LGTYWRRRLRGIDSEMIAPARKMAIYNVVFEAMYRIAGKVGLKVGIIPECDPPPLGMGIIGGADWGP
jgi:hypothetical protein